jgi:TolB-like protein/tetratricopeptide (TPR) repeat protein
MPAILPDYEYDIFISYRQNDNKRDGWVTKFAAALKDELEATLKNPVTIYFDENPHDGLLETHQVGASLEKKLKCLVFIPIISQTFCDTTSFAWEHEFLPFLKMAGDDEVGMNITLANGNVASRVLPVKIHELDAGDQAILVQELGGPIRSIDFIYSEPGVNRPLKPEDKKEDNLNKTNYHNQINKVANALKEIGNALLATSSTNELKSAASTYTKQEVQAKPSRRNPKLVATFVLIPLVLALLYFIPKLFKEANPADEQTDKSIAVLPFRNDSNDPDNIYFCNGLMEDIINQLAQIPDIRVPSATSMLYYRDNPKPYEIIIEELDVAYLLEASVRKMAGRAILNVTLIDATENEQIWSERMEMDLSVKDLFDVQFEVANAVANKMRLAIENNKTDIPTTSYQAYDNFNKARDLMKFWDLEKNRTAIDLLRRATLLDNKFIDALALLGQAYGQRSELSDGGFWVDSARHYSTRAFSMNNEDPGAISALAYAKVLNGELREGLDLYLRAYEISPNAPYNYAGWCYLQLGKYDKAAIWANKNIKDDPNNSIYYVDMSSAVNNLGLFDYSLSYSEKALEINANHKFVYDNLRKAEFYMGNYQKSLEHVQRGIRIVNNLKYEAFQGILYYKLGSLDSARAILNNDFRESFNEESDDEGSKVELYELIQYQSLVKMKLGDETGGRNELEELIISIENNLSDIRPEKFYLLAGCHATLGNTTKAIGYLNKLLEAKYYAYFMVTNNALLDPLHTNKEYLAIIEKMKEEIDAMRDEVLLAGILTK